MVVQSFLTGRDIPMMNEKAISNILIDVDFLEDSLKQIGRPHLASVFLELRLVSFISAVFANFWLDTGGSDDFYSPERNSSRIPCAYQPPCIVCCC